MRLSEKITVIHIFGNVESKYLLYMPRYMCLATATQFFNNPPFVSSRRAVYHSRTPFAEFLLHRVITFSLPLHQVTKALQKKPIIFHIAISQASLTSSLHLSVLWVSNPRHRRIHEHATILSPSVTYGNDSTKSLRPP